MRAKVLKLNEGLLTDIRKDRKLSDSNPALRLY